MANFIKTTKGFTGTEYGITKMWLIHDWLFADRFEASKYNDGKDKPTPFYCVMETNDFAPEIPADGVYLAETLHEAEEELSEY